MSGSASLYLIEMERPRFGGGKAEGWGEGNISSALMDCNYAGCEND